MSSVGLGDGDDGDEGVLGGGDGHVGGDLRSWSGSDDTQQGSASQGDSELCKSQHC